MKLLVYLLFYYLFSLFFFLFMSSFELINFLFITILFSSYFAFGYKLLLFFIVYPTRFIRIYY